MGKDISLTVVMYHYVRPLNDTFYPNIKGHNYDLFKQQIKNILKKYTPVTLSECIYAFENNRTHDLPRNGILFTFDDGYMDHFNYAMPVLDKNNVSGVFFIPVKSGKERKVLDVNKIHFILASGASTSDIISFIKSSVESMQRNYSLKSWNEYYEQYAVPGRYDDKNTIFIKRMLQKVLPKNIRSNLTDKLFKKFVTNDESAFAEQLYMNDDQLKFLLSNGYYLGGHGSEHVWLDSISDNEQDYEFNRSKNFLSELGVPDEDFSFAYPYGGYNEITLQKMQKHDFHIGFTVNVGKAKIEENKKFELNRFDATDVVHL